MSKYLIVDPWPAGFCNVLMSYDIAFAIAHITNREVIVPPTSWCVLIDGMASEKRKPKDEWQNIWEICDRDSANRSFVIHDMLEFEEFKPIINELTNTDPQGYNWLRSDILSNVTHSPHINDSNICIYDSSNNIDADDFLFFTNGRPTHDINHVHRFLRCTGFGHYWYNVYAPGPASRNEMKIKVHDALRYKPKYYNIVKNVFESKHSSFNAIHVRSPWQLIFDDYTDVVQYKDKSWAILQQVKLLFTNDKPLYISTDIEHKEFFDILKQEYEILFYEDFDFATSSPLEKIAVDQIICSKAELFYGSYYSTFSKRINMMRGMDGKQSCDYMGFNKIVESPSYYNNPIPWQENGYRHWNWHDSVHPHWTMEK